MQFRASVPQEDNHCASNSHIPRRRRRLRSRQTLCRVVSLGRQGGGSAGSRAVPQRAEGAREERPRGPAQDAGARKGAEAGEGGEDLAGAGGFSLCSRARHRRPAAGAEHASDRCGLLGLSSGIRGGNRSVQAALLTRIPQALHPPLDDRSLSRPPCASAQPFVRASPARYAAMSYSRPLLSAWRSARSWRWTPSPRPTWCRWFAPASSISAR
mmetsp:Transcript_8125/g.27276  ORF Transcript_8125/g.27276 Transcript_8125/m.27276 type:complete len:213 (-) Transcript_8125:193-831(-)